MKIYVIISWLPGTNEEITFSLYFATRELANIFMQDRLENGGLVPTVEYKITELSLYGYKYS